MSTTIARKVFFFRARFEKKRGCHGLAPTSLEGERICNNIGELGFSDRSRYLDLSGGDQLVAWPELDAPPRMAVATGRREGLPEVERLGAKSRIDLAEDETMVETTHVVFLPDNIVGVEYNYHGPKSTMIAYYLTQKLPWLHKLFLDPITNQDVGKVIESLNDISIIKIGFRPESTEFLRSSHTTLHDIINEPNKNKKIDIPMLELVLKNESRKKTLLKQLERYCNKPSWPDHFQGRNGGIAGFWPSERRTSSQMV